MDELVLKLIHLLLDVVEPAVLHGKIDEQVEIRAARAAADAAALAKFGKLP